MRLLNFFALLAAFISLAACQEKLGEIKRAGPPEIAPVVEPSPENVAQYFDNAHKSLDTSVLISRPAETITEVENWYDAGSHSYDEYSAMMHLLGRLAEIDLPVTDRAIRLIIRFIKEHQDAPTICHTGCQLLMDLPEYRLTEEARKDIRRLILTRSTDDALVRLLGIVGDINTRAYVRRAHTTQPTWWKALALARMGDEGETQKCIDRVRAEKYPEQQMRLLSDLAYIRNAAVLNVVVDFLNSDRIVPGQEGCVPEIPFAGVAARILSREVVGFPLETELPQFYSAKQIAAAQKWTSAHAPFSLRDFNTRDKLLGDDLPEIETSEKAPLQFFGKIVDAAKIPGGDSQHEQYSCTILVLNGGIKGDIEEDARPAATFFLRTAPDKKREDFPHPEHMYVVLAEKKNGEITILKLLPTRIAHYTAQSPSKKDHPEK